MTDVLQVISFIMAASAALDAVLPPTDIPVLKQARLFISLLAVNVGHSQNVAPSQAAKEKSQ